MKKTIKKKNEETGHSIIVLGHSLIAGVVSVSPRVKWFIV